MNNCHSSFLSGLTDGNSVEDGFTPDGSRYRVYSPDFRYEANSFLFNDITMIQAGIWGGCQAAYIQKDRISYWSRETERCVWIKDEQTGEFWRVPSWPGAYTAYAYTFDAGTADIRWYVAYQGIAVTLTLTCPANESGELWTICVKNVTGQQRKLSLYTYMPVGILSWSAQEASFDASVNGMVLYQVPPYIRWQQWETISRLKNYVYCGADRTPSSYEINLDAFWGPGSGHPPVQVQQECLGCTSACQERAGAIFQFRDFLDTDSELSTTLFFGPAHDHADIHRLRQAMLSAAHVRSIAAGAVSRQNAYTYTDIITIETPDNELNAFVNTWLPRQVYYMARTTRMTPNPQMRNYIQDAMGMAYLEPSTARTMLLTAFSQQYVNGAMPDGVLLGGLSQQSFINTIAHRDITVWGALALPFYIGETGDRAILDEPVEWADSTEKSTLYLHMSRALQHALDDRAENGLSRIGEGDWNDPLNMAGHKGRGVSVWLTEALTMALNQWARTAQMYGDMHNAGFCSEQARSCIEAVNKLCWDGSWYARGITDEGRVFGSHVEQEGKIYLNAQSWAMLCGATDTEREHAIRRAVGHYLATPFGHLVLGPGYTKMQDDIGRLSQKVAGYSVNGSVYCQASVFYAYALMKRGYADDGYEALRRLLPPWKTHQTRTSSQLPVYIPNFYRGTAHKQVAGKSHRYVNTGTAAWFYRCVVEMLLGFRATGTGVYLAPCLPDIWDQAKIRRQYLGKTWDVEYVRDTRGEKTRLYVDGKECSSPHIEAGHSNNPKITVVLASTDRQRTTDEKSGHAAAQSVNR
jgi:cellobionic acid phosphorylase